MKPSGPIVQVLPLGLSAAVLSFVSLHQGTYALVDRQRAAIAIWLAIAVLTAFAALPRYRAPRRFWISVGLLAGLAAWVAAGMIWTESSERTFAEVARYAGYAGLLLLIGFAVGRANWRLVASGMLAAAVLTCALAVVSRLWPSAFPPNDVLNNLRIWRLSYPLGYWNAVGCWSAMSVVMCLAASAHARSSFVRALSLAAAPVCLTALYLTFSRAAVGGAIVGVAVLLAFAGYRWLTALHAATATLAGSAVAIVIRGQDQIVHATGSAGATAVALTLAIVALACAAIAALTSQHALGQRMVMSRSRARTAARIGGVLAVLLAITLLVVFGGRARDEFNTTGFEATSSADTRLIQLNGNRVNLWKSAWRAAEAQPLHGTGAGTFGLWWNRDGTNGEVVRDAHNIYLEAFAETGAPGLILLLAFLIAIGYAAVASRAGLGSQGEFGIHAGLLAVFAVFLFQAGLDWMWESTAVAVFALMAVAVAASSGSQRRRDPLAPSRRAALVAIAASATLIQLPGLASASRVEHSRDQFASRDYDAAVRSASSAIDAQPWSATAYGQRALAYESAGNLQAAVRDLSIAQQKEPTNWAWPLLAVRVEVKRGNAEAAKRELRRARALNKYSEVFNDR